MSSLARASTSEDLEALTAFLARVFETDRNAPFLNPALLHWKYWAPRADFPDPRSLVIEKDAQIVAHVGLWPVTIQTESGLLRGVHMIDWASDPLAPGAGVSLLQRLTKSFDFVIAIGGTDMTRSILPRFGFRILSGQAQTVARPVRPFRQALEHQSRNARLPLRLARNAFWSLSPSSADAKGWEVQLIAAKDADAAPAASLERGNGFFEYFAKCPAARVLCFQMLHNGANAGMFCLSVAGGQARLAGIWLEAAAVSFRRIAFELVLRSVLRHTDASELIARSISAEAIESAASAGLRLRESVPVFLFRRQTRPPTSDAPPLSLQYQLIEDDGAFLWSEKTEFLT